MGDFENENRNVLEIYIYIYIYVYLDTCYVCSGEKGALFCAQF